MFYFVLTIHLILCVLIIGMVLLQQGKGAQVGAILSGSSNTLFGAAGASTTFAKLTTIFAVSFFATSLILIKLYDGGHAPRSTSPMAAGSTSAAGALEGTVLGQMVQKSNAVDVESAAPETAPVSAPVAANNSSVVSSSSAAVVEPVKVAKPVEKKT